MVKRPGHRQYMAEYRKGLRRTEAGRQKLLAANGASAPAPAPVAGSNPTTKQKMSWGVLDRARVKRGSTKVHNPFLIANTPHWLPKSKTLAMDKEIVILADHSTQQFLLQQPELGTGIQDWRGFGYLAMIATIPEINQIVCTLAEESTRKFIKIISTSDEDDKSDKIAESNDCIKHFKLQEKLYKIVKLDAEMGRAHLFFDIGNAAEDREELLTPIGNGSPDDPISKAKLKKGCLRDIKVLDPYWLYPTGSPVWNSIDPLLDYYYEPQYWLAMTKSVHISRLLLFCSNPVPDILKPAFQFAGLSLAQRAHESVQYWRSAREHVARLVSNFSVFHLSTDLQSTLQLGEDELFKRIELFNLLRDNQGLLAINKDTEEIGFQNVPLGTLDSLLSAFQEQQSAISRIPLVKLLGISPHGLNATAEPELRVYYETILAFQERFLRPHLTTVLNILQIHLFGKADSQIGFIFESLHEPNELEAAQVRQINTQTAQTLIDSGIISPQEERERLAEDPDSEYQNIEVEATPDSELAFAGFMGEQQEDNENENEDEHAVQH